MWPTRFTTPTPASRSDSSPPAPTPDARDLHLQNIYGLLAEGIGHLISRDRDEQRWRIVMRTAISALVAGGRMMWLARYAPMLGGTSEPTAKSIGVIPIQGAISQNGATTEEVSPPSNEPALPAKRKRPYFGSPPPRRLTHRLRRQRSRASREFAGAELRTAEHGGAVRRTLRGPEPRA